MGANIMTKVVLTTRVGADGVLTLPLGEAEAGKMVRVLVEPLDETPAMDRASWLRFLDSTGGKVTDPTFERPAQGEYEQRDEWP
jgi:hypothetical protein